MQSAAERMPDQFSPRRRFQFRLRTLMIVVTLLALPCGYVGWQAKIVRERKVLRETVIGSFVTAEDFSKMVQGGAFKLETLPHVSWLRRLLGDEAIVTISVFKVDDVDAVRVAFPEAEVNRLDAKSEPF